MKNNKPYQISALVFVGLSLIMLTTQCTKENEIASQVSRALVETPDSALFSPFYDSTQVIGSNTSPDANDYAIAEGVLTIIRNNCASAPCHGGGVSPTLTSYNSILSMVTPGSPENSELFKLITTSDLNRAMPPISYGVDLSVTEKSVIYNWIKNGAKEIPDLQDYRPAAVQLITSGCASANCHNAATVGGEWARASLITVAPGDTASFTYFPPGGTPTIYAQLKEPKLSQVWNAYKDSVRRFYSDTVANKPFRPYKTMNTPVVRSNRRGPLNSYDDIVFDVLFPKAIRSNRQVQYTDPVSGQQFYVGNDQYDGSSTMLSRVDSTLVAKNLRTGVWRTSHQGGMAFEDGGLKSGEIGIIKAWYFLDPNIPDVWKYGLDGQGIFQYRTTGHVIKKQ